MKSDANRGTRRRGEKPTVLYSLVSLVEWVSAGIVMYVILLLFGIEIEFQKFLGVYVILCFSWCR